MSAVVGIYDNAKNLWTFSKCSVATWKALLLVKNTTVNSACSSLSNIPGSITIGTKYFTNYMPGQLWTIDQQCIMGMNWNQSSGTICAVCFKCF